MSEQDLITKIILNLGDKTPWLLVVFMFVRWMWPDIKTLALEYLKHRDLPERADPVEVKLDALATGVNSLVATLNAFIGEARISAQRQDVVWMELVSRVAPVLGPPAVQPPVSPSVGVAVGGRGVLSRLSGEGPDAGPVSLKVPLDG